jgi:hypothetical protein
MISLMLMAALSCGTPTINNDTGTWDKYDQGTLERAEKRCGELYPDAPCLTQFFKSRDKDGGINYSVLCGSK